MGVPRVVGLAALCLGLLTGCARGESGGTPAAVAEPPTGAPADAPPDIVVVLVDAWRADAGGFAGHPLPCTPSLDALAAEATWFSRAYAASSWTLPSTVSLLTGVHPWEHRAIRDVENRELFGRLRGEIPTLATRLKGNGYRTAAFVNNTLLAPEFGLDQGFDRYDFHGAAPVGHRTAADTVALAADWLDAQGADAPVFLLVHLQEPHEDYDPPPPFAGRFSAELPHAVQTPLGEVNVKAIRRGALPLSDDDRAYIRAVYAEEVAATDAAIGRLLEHLRARPGWDRSWLAVTGDHGEEFWDHGGYEHGHTTRSVVTRVPLLVRGPGVKPGENRTVVGHLDLFRALAGDDELLWQLARAGELRPGRRAISEGGLYGPLQISVVTDDLRLVIHPLTDPPTASLYAIDEAGREGDDLGGDPAERERAAPLYLALEAARGHLAPVDAFEPVGLAPDVMEQLRALGYLE